jgi:hypothetical protein
MVCGSEYVFATLQIKATIDGSEKEYILQYCYSCWKDSFGQYILDQLDP